MSRSIDTMLPSYVKQTCRVEPGAFWVWRLKDVVRVDLSVVLEEPWAGSRAAELDQVVVRELTADLLQDFLVFFDKDAFSDNPSWASCYCVFYHFPGTGKE